MTAEKRVKGDKPGRVPDPDRVRPCRGTCGRMTRPSKMKATEVPFPTISRRNKYYCCTCATALGEDILRAEGLPVPPRGMARAVKAVRPEKLAAVTHEIDVFTARRRARLARKGWMLHEPTGLPRTELDRRRAAAVRPARGPGPAPAEQERTG